MRLRALRENRYVRRLPLGKAHTVLRDADKARQRLMISVRRASNRIDTVLHGDAADAAPPRLRSLKTAEREGSPEAALSICERLLESGDNEYARHAKARLLTKLGRLDEAKVVVSDNERDFPRRLENYVVLGRIAERQQMYEASLGAWIQALGVDSNHEEANLSKVRMLLKLGRAEEAFEHAKRFPHPTNMKLMLAKHLREMSEPEAALSVLDELLTVDRENNDGLLASARILLERSRLSEAKQALDRMTTTTTASEVIRARLCERLGRYREARDSWNAVLSADPRHLEGALSLESLQAKESSRWPVADLDLSLDRDREIVDRVRKSIVKNKLGRHPWWKDEYADDHPTEYQRYFDDIETYVERHSYMRYNRSAFSVVPWIGTCIKLAESTVVEVGCGTGSTTAVLASSSKYVHAYDIDPQVLATATVRLEAMGIDNVSLMCHEPEDIQVAIMKNHEAGRIDVVVLYAVVEHQTIDERFEALENAWKLVRPAGILAVVEAPNRLTYFDWHSSLLPFFHMLPLDLQLRYCLKSPRADYGNEIEQWRVEYGADAAKEHLIRWGQSVSYHDFEIVFGDLGPLVVADGYHPLMERTRPQREKKGENALRQFVEEEKLDIHPAFTRANIDVVLRKPSIA